MHRAIVFSKEVFSILNHMFSFLCLLFVTTLHITGVSVLICFKGIPLQIPVWQPVPWLLLAPRSTDPGISFKAELQHIFKRFFQFSLLELASFSLLHILGVRCPAVTYHNAAWCQTVTAPSVPADPVTVLCMSPCSLIRVTCSSQ